MKKVLLLFAMVVFHTIAFCQSQFQGEWHWSNENDSFTLNLKEDGATVKGSICSVMQQGNRIDCGDDDADNFVAQVSGNKIATPFYSYYCDCKGKAEIIFVDANHLKWKVIEKPKGEYYIPDEVILTKATKE